MRVLVVRLLLVLAIALPTGLVAATAGAAPDPASELVAATNAARAGQRLGSLDVSSELAAVAQRHSERMAAEGRLYHNPDLQNDVRGWLVVGENVGIGPSASAIHDEFMLSASHRSNILEPRYTQIGVGVVEVDGRLWATAVFRQPIAAPATPRRVTATPTPAPLPAPAPSPAAVAPPAPPAPAAPEPPAPPAPAQPAATAAPEQQIETTADAPARPAVTEDEQICVPVRGGLACVTLHVVVQRVGGVSATI